METREQLEATIRTQLDAEYLEKYTADIKDARKRLQGDNDVLIKQTIDDLQKKATPLTPEEIGKLLSQEYITFSVKVKVRNSEPLKEFTLVELPQAVEKKFYSSMKAVLLPRLKEIGDLTFKVLEGDVAEKARTLIETFEPAMDLMAEACALCLNPYGEEEEITKDWVQENISSSRMFNILQAQIHVNRLRDFFSAGSLNSGNLNNLL